MWWECNECGGWMVERPGRSVCPICGRVSTFGVVDAEGDSEGSGLRQTWFLSGAELWTAAVNEFDADHCWGVERREVRS